MSNVSNQMVIRQFTKDDMPLLGELYRAVTSNKDAVFFWVGDEDNWINVYCAFENGKMIAKGQLEIINIVPDNRPKDCKNTIFINLKTVPERENDQQLLNSLYEPLYKRALQLKDSLHNQYQTLLCVGNSSTDTANNDFFINKGFNYLYSLYSMTRHLDDSIPEIKLDNDVKFSFWKMETTEEEQKYLSIEAEIWPDTPLGLKRLLDYKNNKLWTSMVLYEGNTIIAGLMVWQENEDEGIIEDVFVRENWRRRGYAQYLLVQALTYLKQNNLRVATLTALTTNESALTLYKSIGFKIDSEEIRYGIALT